MRAGIGLISEVLHPLLQCVPRSLYTCIINSVQDSNCFTPVYLFVCLCVCALSILISPFFPRINSLDFVSFMHCCALCDSDFVQCWCNCMSMNLVIKPLSWSKQHLHCRLLQNECFGCKFCTSKVLQEGYGVIAPEHCFTCYKYSSHSFLFTEVSILQIKDYFQGITVDLEIFGVKYFHRLP